MTAIDENWQRLGDVVRKIVINTETQVCIDDPYIITAIKSAAREQRTTPNAIVREAISAYLGVG